MTEIDNKNGDARPSAPRNPDTGAQRIGTSVGDLRTTRAAAQGHRNVAMRKLLIAGKRQLTGLALLLVLIGAGVAYGGALLWPAQYAARAEILYEISTEKPTGFLREDRSLTTQLVLLRGRQVLGPVAVHAGLPIEEFEKKVSVELVDSSEVIRVEVHADSHEAARRQTQAIVDRYLQIAPVANSSDMDRYLRAELTDVQQRRAGAEAEAERQRELRANGASDASAVSAAEVTSEGLADREQELHAQLDELKVAEIAASRPEVVAPPYVLADQVSPRPLFAAATGALAGFVVATCAVAVVAHHSARG